MQARRPALPTPPVMQPPMAGASTMGGSNMAALPPPPGTAPGTMGSSTAPLLPPGTAPGAMGGPVMPMESREIPIPAELIGGIIGPGGSTINELRKQAGTTVLIAIVPGNIPTAQGGQQL